MFVQSGKVNWKYLIIVLIVAVLAIGGILVFQWQLSKEESKPITLLTSPALGEEEEEEEDGVSPLSSQPSPVEEVENGSEKPKEAGEGGRTGQIISEIEEELKKCEQDEWSKKKQECYFYLALWFNNEQVCEKMEGFIRPEEVERIESFKEMMIMGGLGGCKNEEECEAYCQDPAHTNIIECMKFMGFQKMGGPGGCKSEEECKAYCSDPDHIKQCMEFESFKEKTYCIAVIKKDPTECQKFAKDEEIQCLALVYRNLKKCNETKILRDDCYALVITYSSLLDKDISFCDNFSEKSERDNCYKTYAGAMMVFRDESTYDSNVCDLLQNSSRSPLKDMCYIAAAFVKKDSNFCKMVEIKNPIDRREQCLRLFELITGDTFSFCEKYKNEKKEECYSAIINFILEPESSCKDAFGDYLTNNLLATECYQYYSSIEKDSNICAEIENSQIRSSCYQKLSK